MAARNDILALAVPWALKIYERDRILLLGCPDALLLYMVFERGCGIFGGHYGMIKIGEKFVENAIPLTTDFCFI